jgi:hypothetical protein
MKTMIAQLEWAKVKTKDVDARDAEARIATLERMITRASMWTIGV